VGYKSKQGYILTLTPTATVTTLMMPKGGETAPSLDMMGSGIQSLNPCSILELLAGNYYHCGS